ncbi:MAG: hypothetical protein ACRDZ1_17005, partial [Acidimicrobiia bacterium]
MSRTSTTVAAGTASVGSPRGMRRSQSSSLRFTPCTRFPANRRARHGERSLPSVEQLLDRFRLDGRVAVVTGAGR